MKKIFTVLLLFVIATVTAQNNCENAKPFCAGGVSGETFPASTNITSAQTGPNYGCLGSTPNPAWYFLQINQSGNLDILIQGTITTPPSPGQDVDFICWGPFNSLQGICDSLTLNKIVDCSYSASFTETLNIVNGISGQYYLVLITNFANVVQNIEFTQYAGNGTTNCGLVGSNSKICAGNSATVVASNSGSLTSPTYSMNPGGLTSTTGTFIVTPTVTTTYSLFISGINNISQPLTQTAVAHVTVNPQPTVAPTVTNTSCTSTVNAFNLNMSFYPLSSNPSYSITWNPTPNGIVSAQQSSLTGGINPNTYNATLTAAGGCSVETSFTIDPQPEPAIIDIQPLGFGYTLTCYEPVINFTSMVATNNYTWSNGLNAPVTGQYASLTYSNAGSWTVSAVNPVSGCISSKVFALGINTIVPTNTVIPAFQNITCSVSSISLVNSTASPSVNVSHLISSPYGASVTILSYTSSYLPGGPGVYVDCAINDVNGCSSCKEFTVVANQGYPQFNVQSPQSFTLGCTTKSVAVINIVGAVATDSNQIPNGGPVSYTLLSPSSASATPPGTLSSNASYTVNVPGTWTVITKDNTTFCETRVPISVLENTIAPNISVVYPQQVLSCDVPKIILHGQSLTSNVDYLWSFQGLPGNQPSDSISVNINTAAPNATVINVYTLTITDISSTCKSTSVVPMYQNTFKPNVIIAVSSPSLTCKTTTIVLTNQSTTGIKGNFQTDRPVVTTRWDGPTPQEPLVLSTTYVGSTPGVYTMTARDLNNGCINTGTVNLIDFKIYPILKAPAKKQIFACGEPVDSLFMEVPNQTATFSFTWAAPPGVSIVNQYKNPLITSSPGLYKLLAYNSANGCYATGDVTFYNDSLTAAFEMDKEKGFAPMVVNASNLSTSNSDNSKITSFWDFGNGTFSTTTSAGISPNINYTAPGIFTIKLFAFKGTCKATASRTVQVDLPSSISIPNVFTPNGDKVNDEYFLKADNLSEITFVIVDRWGHVVYELTSQSGNVSWDGKNQAGQDVAEGTYFFTLKASGTDGQTYDQKGTISLIR